MNPNRTHQGLRPGFLWLGALGLLLLGLGLYWRGRDRPATAETAEPATEAVEPVAATPPPAAAEAAALVPANPFEDKWGIRIAGIALAQGGAAVELRYLVLDTEKTARWAEGLTNVYILDQATGTKISLATPLPQKSFRTHSRARSQALMMPQGASLATAANRFAPGKILSILLPNWGGVVQQGSRLALVIGDLPSGELVVGQ